MPLNYPALLLALGMLESGNDDMAVGKLGEVSRYQIMPQVWPEYCLLGQNMPLERARVSSVAETVATRILEDRIASFMVGRKRQPTPQQVYILWNAPAQVNKPSRKVVERAERFANLYEKYVMEESKK